VGGVKLRFMLDARRLAVLAAVVAEGSMTAAAARLAMSPSAVSQQVAALERSAGAALLVRGPRGVRPTDAGRLLADHAAAVDRRLERAERDLADLVAVRAGRLRLAAFPTAGARLLPTAIGAFRARHPDVAVTLAVREPEECPAAVREGDLDLAVVFEHPGGEPLDRAGLLHRHLLDDGAAVALPPGHRLAGGTGPVSVAELREEAWVRDTGPSCRRLLDRLCARAGFTPRIAFDSDDYATAGRLVAAGVGIALVPDLARDQVGPDLVLRPVRPRATRRVAVLTGPDPSPAARAFDDLLRAGDDRARPSSRR
jgi:DNA-binding transcriptional LysR family regulator